MPTRDELLDALARADRLALAVYLRSGDGPVGDTVVELRGHLQSLGTAVALRPYRWLPVVSYLAAVTGTVGAAVGMRLLVPWYIAVPLATLAGALAFTWARGIVAPSPYVDLAARDVPTPDAVGLPALLEELSETMTGATAVIGAWRRATVHSRPDRRRPYRFEPAPLVVHADACLARLRGLVDGEALALPGEPQPLTEKTRDPLRRLRTALPWVHALAHDAHRDRSGRRLARMEAAYRLLHTHLPNADERHRPPRSGPSRLPHLAFALAGAALAVSPWPVVAALTAAMLAFTVVAAPTVGPDTCLSVRRFNRAEDVPALAAEAARRVEETAREVGGPVGEVLLRVRDLLRGRGSG